jgi:hypothetical protein
MDYFYFQREVYRFINSGDFELYCKTCFRQKEQNEVTLDRELI